MFFPLFHLSISEERPLSIFVALGLSFYFRGTSSTSLLKKGLNSTKNGLFSQSVSQSVTHSVTKIMNNIRIRICSRLELWILFIVVFVPENQIFGTLQTLQSFNLIRTLESYKKVFNILSLSFRLAGSSKLWFHYFQIFKFIWIHKYMFLKNCELYFHLYSLHIMSIIIFIITFIEYVFYK